MPQVVEQPSNISVLRKTRLLTSLPDNVLMELAGQSKMALAQRTEIIWLHGKQADFFGVVGTGFVKMTRPTTHGQDITTELMGPGQIFGLLGVVDGHGCPQAAKAVSDTWFLKVPKQAIRPILGSHHELNQVLVDRTSGRLRRAFDRIARMTTGMVEDRIASVILLLCESYAVEEGDVIHLDIPLTRQDIAEMAGTTVESTIRVMSRWQKDGIVESTRKRLSILEMSRLEAMI
jgi:CRP-like cAMP-binding protein